MNFFIDWMNYLSEQAVKVCFFNILSIFGVTSVSLPIGVFIIIFFVIFLNIYLELIPIKIFFKSIIRFFTKRKVKKEESGNGISSISAMLTTVASNTGLGATAGSALMITVAGPGTVFWLPFAIIFCVAVKMAEIYLGHKYREKEGDNYVGGPFLYLKKGLKEKGFEKLGAFLSSTYLILMLIIGIFGVSVLEMNQFTKIIVNEKIFANRDIIVSLSGVIFVGIIIIGGIKRISKLFNFLMPILVTFFIFFSFITIFKSRGSFFSAISIIYQDAFNIKAGIGAMVMGIIMVFRRVIISTETCFGTAGIIHASSNEKNSMKEAISGMASPAISGFFISFLTSFLIVITGVYETASSRDGIVVVSNALEKGFWFFPHILLILTVIMALNVTIGWSYYGASYSTTVFGKKAKYLYITLYLICGFIGGILNDFQAIINFVDSFAFTLCAVNIFGVLFLIKDIKNSMIDYIKNEYRK